METQLSPTPIKPVEFSDITVGDACKWCESEMQKDTRGFSVCPHCDKPCGFDPCRECATAAERLPAQFTEAEREVAAAAPPAGHYWWPRRFWQAVRRCLPFPPAGWYFDDDEAA